MEALVLLYSLVLTVPFPGHVLHVQRLPNNPGEGSGTDRKHGKYEAKGT